MDGAGSVRPELEAVWRMQPSERREQPRHGGGGIPGTPVLSPGPEFSRPFHHSMVCSPAHQYLAGQDSVPVYELPRAGHPAIRHADWGASSPDVDGDATAHEQ